MTPQLHTQTCTVCGTTFQGSKRKPGVNVFCSQPCRNVAKRTYVRFLGNVPATFTLTPLNRETTLRWLACLAANTHQPGETLTGVRTWTKNGKGYDAPMPVCDVCAVPFPDLSVGFRLAGSAA